MHYIIIYNITYYFIQHVNHEISEFPTVDWQRNLVVRLDHVWFHVPIYTPKQFTWKQTSNFETPNALNNYDRNHRRDNRLC